LSQSIGVAAVSHIAEEILESYAMGAIPVDGTAVIEEHLLICPACCDRLAELDAFVSGMRGAALLLRKLGATRRNIRRDKATTVARSADGMHG
jgi:anti-sigma factor RsiW